MNRVLALACLLFPTTALLAQDQIGPPDKDMALIAKVDGGALVGWEVAEGDHVFNKDGIVLGGKGQTKLRLTAPVGDRFRLRLDYTLQGGQPMLHFETNRPIVWTVPHSGTKGAELVISGSRGSWHTNAYWRYSQRTLEGSSSNGGLPGGAGPIRQLYLLVPAGATVHLRAADLHATVAPVPSSSALVSALVILGLVLASICLLGWLLNRRRAPTIPRAVQ